MSQKTIEISKITIPFNPRRDFGKVKEIAESITAVGILNPIVVRTDEKGTIILVDGNQRLEAMKSLKQKEIPCHVVEFKNEQTAHEAQMIANLMRSDLTFMEKARGYTHLLNDKAKYNEATIAKRFGLKEALVKVLVEIGRKIDPACDAIIDKSDELDIETVKKLCFIPKEHQFKIIKVVADNGGHISSWSMEKAGFYQLDFSDVFGYEKAKADGKIGFEIKYNKNHGEVYTADKKYFEECKAAHEAEEKKKGRGGLYGEGEKKRAKVSEATLEKEKADRKKVNERKKKVKEEAYVEMSKALSKYMEKAASKDFIAKVSKRWAYALSTDDCKHLLRAFKVEFTGEDFSDKLKAKVWEKILSPMCKDGATALRLLEWTELPRNGSETDTSGFKAWLKSMES